MAIAAKKHAQIDIKLFLSCLTRFSGFLYFVPNILSRIVAPMRRCLGYSEVYCDARKRWLLAWNQNRHITHCILHIPYTNTKISIIGLIYICPHFFWWHRLKNPNLPTSILVLASVVSFLTFNTSTIFAPLWFTNFQPYRF